MYAIHIKKQIAGIFSSKPIHKIFKKSMIGQLARKQQLLGSVAVFKHTNGLKQN